MIRNCKNGDWFAFFPILRGKSAFFRYFVLSNERHSAAGRKSELGSTGAHFLCFHTQLHNCVNVFPQKRKMRISCPQNASLPF